MGRERDAALVRDCRRGDPRAMELLVRRFERPIYNAAYRLVGNLEDAKDVTQGVFLKAFEHLDQYDDRYKLFSWIYRIAINDALNLLHRRGRQQPLEEVQVTEADGPDIVAARQELSGRIQRALMRLKLDQRTVIVLRHFGELSYRDMSVVLDIPEKTVKSRLFEARRRLSQLLDEDGVR